MAKEKKLKKEFKNFSTVKQLKVVDDQMRRKGLSVKDKKANNIKWQMNGVLDAYHLPKKDATNNNFGFKEQIHEIQKTLQYKKDFNETMSRMNLAKMNHLVAGQQEKLGYVTRKKNNELALLKLCEELH